MTRYHATSEGNIPFTPEEELEWDAREAEALAAAPGIAKAAFIKQVDQDADNIIRDTIGWRATEYLRAEQEAAAYAAAGYTGDVPVSVSSEATAKGITAQVACDTIIATATAWRTAQASLRAERLLAKALAGNAVDGAALNTIKASWAAFIAALRTQLGVS